MTTSSISSPIKAALGSNWEKLHPVIQQHYSLPRDMKQSLSVSGKMDVTISGMGRLFVVLARVFAALVPFAGKQIPVLVKRSYSSTGETMYWHRTFQCVGRDPTVFQSRMVHVANNLIIEKVRFGMGIRMALSVQDGALRFDSQGYEWNFRLFRLYLPDWLMLGKAVAREIPLSDNSFQVVFEIKHLWWGRTFGYSGELRFDDNQREIDPGG